MENQNVFNFSAGPAILPQEVFKKSAEAVLNFNNSGLSILEISHRSKDFVAVLDEAVANVKTLLNLNDDYAVLFLTGGASSQFYMTAMNLLGENQTASYLDTGAWSKKSIKEAQSFGNVEIVASSKDKNYSYIPKGYEVAKDSQYLHLTSNNTIFGTQIHDFPEVEMPIVCDMSSDIFSRRLPIEKFGIIYAGAQKNMGPAGTTLVIVRKDLLGKIERNIPTMLDYRTHIDKNSSFNTPPVFPIFVSNLTMKWVLENGGLEGMEKRNAEKAALLYAEIDRNPLFKGVAATEDRSLMNVTFVLNDDSLNEEFMSLATAAKCSGIKGHRSVGGFRASIYNAMPLAGIKALISAMQDLEAKHA